MEQVRYQILHRAENDRVFYVGDLHGCYDLLMEELDKLGFDKTKDTLICTGDLIDRGKKNLECLELLSEPWFFSVEGNHEVMARNSVNNPDNREAFHLWFYNGGHWYMDLFETEDQRYADELIRSTTAMPHVIEVNHGNRRIVVCHANYPANTYPSEDVSVNDILWNRDRYQEWFDRNTGTQIEGADLFIFGHSPVSRPHQVENQMYIDTGAVFLDGRLTIKEF